jgi:hypothetical protein
MLQILGAFVSAVLGKLVADDLKSWSPRFAERLVRCAVAKLPEDQRGRYDEEWHAHINDVPGELSKALTAVGLMFAAGSMARAARATEEAQRAIQAEARVWFVGLVETAFVSVLLKSSSEPISRDAILRDAIRDTILSSFAKTTREITDDVVEGQRLYRWWLATLAIQCIKPNRLRMLVLRPAHLLLKPRRKYTSEEILVIRDRYQKGVKGAFADLRMNVAKTGITWSRAL